MKRYVASLITLTLLGCAAALADHHKSKAPAAHGPDHAIHRAADVKWLDGPGSLAPGAKYAVLEGDPAKEGLFTMRLRLPDGFKIQPHVHPAVEHVMVISGTFNLGMGDKFDQNATLEMPAGTFGYWKPGMKHFAWAKGETILQLHGIGPWKIEYVNPADDPRNRAKSGKPKI